MGKRIIIITILLIAVLITLSYSNGMAEVGYKGYLLGDSKDNIIKKLNENGVKYDEAKDDTFGSNPSGFTNTTNIIFDDGDWKVFIFFDYNDKVMQIHVNSYNPGLWGIVKSELVKKYGEPVVTENNERRVILTFKINKVDKIEFTGYINYSLIVEYINTELLNNCRLKNEKDENAATDSNYQEKARQIHKQGF